MELPPGDVGLPLREEWSAGYILLSYAIASLGSCLSLELMKNRSGVAGKRNMMLLAGGAVALGGVGIWAMHFVGMMALCLRTASGVMVPMAFEPGMTVASAIAPCVIAAVGFLIAGNPERPRWWKNLIAGSAGGIGVAGMHYLGMVSMVLQADAEWDGGIIAASVIVGIVVATVAMSILFRFSKLWAHDIRMQIGTSAIMGVAVCGMHYTGMQSVTYRLSADPLDLSSYSSQHELLIATLTLAGGTSVIMLALRIKFRLLLQQELEKARCLTLAALIYQPASSGCSDAQVLLGETGAPPSVIIDRDFVGESGLDVSSAAFLRIFRTGLNWEAMDEYLQQQEQKLAAAEKSSAAVGGKPSVTRAQIALYRKFVAAARRLSEQLNLPLSAFGKINWTCSNKLVCIVFDPAEVRRFLKPTLASPQPDFISRLGRPTKRCTPTDCVEEGRIDSVARSAFEVEQQPSIAAKGLGPRQQSTDDGAQRPSVIGRASGAASRGAWRISMSRNRSRNDSRAQSHGSKVAPVNEAAAAAAAAGEAGDEAAQKTTGEPLQQGPGAAPGHTAIEITTPSSTAVPLSTLLGSIHSGYRFQQVSKFESQLRAYLRLEEGQTPESFLDAHARWFERVSAPILPPPQTHGHKRNRSVDSALIQHTLSPTTLTTAVAVPSPTRAAKIAEEGGTAASFVQARPPPIAIDRCRSTSRASPRHLSPNPAAVNPALARIRDNRPSSRSKFGFSAIDRGGSAGLGEVKSGLRIMAPSSRAEIASAVRIAPEGDADRDREPLSPVPFSPQPPALPAAALSDSLLPGAPDDAQADEQQQQQLPPLPTSPMLNSRSHRPPASPSAAQERSTIKEPPSPSPSPPARSPSALPSLPPIAAPLSVAIYYSQASHGRSLQVAVPLEGPWGMLPCEPIRHPDGAAEEWEPSLIQLLLDDLLSDPTAGAASIDIADGFAMVKAEEEGSTTTDLLIQQPSLPLAAQRKYALTVQVHRRVGSNGGGGGGPSLMTTTARNSFLSSPPPPIDQPHSPSPQQANRTLRAPGQVRRTSTPAASVQPPPSLPFSNYASPSQKPLTLHSPFTPSRPTNALHPPSIEPLDLPPPVQLSPCTSANGPDPSTLLYQLREAFFDAVSRLSDKFGSSVGLDLADLHPRVLVLAPGVRVICFVHCLLSPILAPELTRCNAFIALPLFELVHRIAIVQLTTALRAHRRSQRAVCFPGPSEDELQAAELEEEKQLLQEMEAPGVWIRSLLSGLLLVH